MITPTQLLEMVSFELDLIEAVIAAVALRRTLETSEAKLLADELIEAFVQVHAYQCRN
jgi:hypothetical protein